MAYKGRHTEENPPKTTSKKVTAKADTSKLKKAPKQMPVKGKKLTDSYFDPAQTQVIKKD